LQSLVSLFDFPDLVNLLDMDFPHQHVPRPMWRRWIRPSLSGKRDSTYFEAPFVKPMLFLINQLVGGVLTTKVKVLLLNADNTTGNGVSFT
jgi:hypothetical protein